MTLAEISRELAALLPEEFADSDQAEVKELLKMQFPKDFARLYQEKNPVEGIEVGRFNFLRLQDLINENIWDSPGDTLYELGYPVVGTSPDGCFYCLNMNEKNKNQENDVLLVSPDEEYAGLTAKEARKSMKYLHDNFAAFLAKEFEFLKKTRSKKKL